MSTKATVAYGKNFHFYKEVLDEDFIYLEMGERKKEWEERKRLLAGIVR